MNNLSDREKEIIRAAIYFVLDEYDYASETFQATYDADELGGIWDVKGITMPQPTMPELIDILANL